MSAICPNGHESASNDYCDVCGAPIPPQNANLDVRPAAPLSPRPAVPVPAPQVCPNCGAVNVAAALFCEACGYDFTTGTPPRSATPTSAVPDTELPAPDAAATKPAGTDAVEPEASAADQGKTADATPAGSLDLDAPAAPPVQVDTDVASEVRPPASVASVAPLPLPPVAPQPVQAPPAASRPVSEAYVPRAPKSGPLEWVAEVWIDPDWYAAQGSTDALPSPGLPDVVPLRGTTALIGRTSRSRNIYPDIDCGMDAGVSRRHTMVTFDGSRWWVEDQGSANGTFIGSPGAALPTGPIPTGRTELDDDQRIYVGAWTRIVVRRATDDEVQAFA